MRYHDFIWHSRPTRVGYPLNAGERAGQWWGSEAPGLPADSAAKKIKEHTAQARMVPLK